MRVNPKVKATPMRNRGGSLLSAEVAFFSLPFRPDGTSEEEEEEEEEEEAAERR